MKTKLTPGQKLTIFSISSWMAHTTKQEITVGAVLEKPEARLHYQDGPVEGHRYGALTPRGKRKEYHLDIRLGDLVFEGWDLPVMAESEIKNGFQGNACLTMGLRAPMSEPRLDVIFLRAFIAEKNLNEMSDDTKGCVVCVRRGDEVGDEGILVWPEIEVAHAVVNRMKEKIAVAA